jgi:hypothetical protein
VPRIVPLLLFLYCCAFVLHFPGTDCTMKFSSILATVLIQAIFAVVSAMASDPPGVVVLTSVLASSLSDPSRMTVTKTTGGVALNYNFNDLYDDCGTWTATSPITRNVELSYVWNGDHSYFLARLDGYYSVGSDALVKFLASDLFGPFSFSGTLELNLLENQPFSITLCGHNYDYANRISGTFELQADPFETLPTLPVTVEPTSCSVAKAVSFAKEGVVLPEGTVCQPADGSTFPVGTTAVSCSNGVFTPGTFNIKVSVRRRAAQRRLSTLLGTFKYAMCMCDTVCIQAFTQSPALCHMSDQVLSVAEDLQLLLKSLPILNQPTQSLDTAQWINR